MIKFNEWLENRQQQQLNEAGPARLRTRYQAPSELSNVGIGRIGPLGTFGQETGQGNVERGIGGVLGALGQAIQKDLVKPTAVSRQEAPLILKRLAEGVPLEIYMKLPLQLPKLPDNTEYMKVSPTSGQAGVNTNIKNIRDNIGNVLSDKRIRRENDIKDDGKKFVHISREMIESDPSAYQYAVAFTTALIIEVIIKQHTNLEEYFDFKKPKIVSQQVDSDGQIDVGIQLKPTKALPLGKTAREISPDDPKEKDVSIGDDEE